MNELIIREDGGVAWLTLNRPEHLNALDDVIVKKLSAYFSSLRTRPDVRVVVMTGAGRGFCAGLDLNNHPAAQSRMDVEEALAVQNEFGRIIVAMRQCPQPIVALVNGVATGGGFAIALAADIRIATPETRVNAAFIRVGLSACELGVSYLFPRMVGSSIAAEYLMTGRFLDAERGRAIGFYSNVVPREKLQEEAESLVADLLHASRIGLAMTKDSLNLSLDAPSLEAAIAMESRGQVLCMQHDNFQEGIAAFREKRAPVYR
jgi:enoyl-CoA hydratase/carnithine racemase